MKSTTVLSRQDLGTLGGAFSYAADINAGNTVVGWSQTSTGAIHAFSWSAGPGMVDLGTLAGDESSRALAILDSKGQGDALILGVSTRGSQSTPVVWSTTGAIRELPIPPIATGAMSLPTDFNSRGDVVGSDAGIGVQHGWVWLTNGTKYDLSANVSGGSTEGSANAVSSAGIVLLTTRAFTCKRSTDCWRSYLWRSNGGYSALGTPGNDPEANVTGLALTDGGDVVGWLTSAATGGATPYRWNASSGFTTLAHYAADGSRYGYATAVNSSGTVVGGDWDPAAGAIVASTWRSNGSIAKLTPDDPNPSVAVALNASGTIAGWAVSGGNNHAVIWKPASQGVVASLSASPSFKARIAPPSAKCLSELRSIASRTALFGCVAQADVSH